MKLERQFATRMSDRAPVYSKEDIASDAAETAERRADPGF